MRLMYTFIAGLILISSSSYAQGVDMNNVPLEKATFAGGCFWCMQPFLDHLKGVKKTTVGYTGGHTANPSYEEVSTGQTGHAEAIEVSFDPQEVSYEKVLNVFLHNIDPTMKNGQFVDQGTQYRSAIFYHNDAQKRLAQEGLKKLSESGRFDKPIVTEIVPASAFYPAEEYHQGYYKKDSFRYNMYSNGSGRKQFIEKVWGKQEDH